MPKTRVQVWNHLELVEDIHVLELESPWSFTCDYLTDDPTARINIYALRDDLVNTIFELVPREDAFEGPEFTLHVHELPEDMSLFTDFTSSHLVTCCHFRSSVLCRVPHKALTGVADLVVHTDGSHEAMRDWMRACPDNICVSYI